MTDSKTLELMGLFANYKFKPIRDSRTRRQTGYQLLGDESVHYKFAHVYRRHRGHYVHVFLAINPELESDYFIFTGLATRSYLNGRDEQVLILADSLSKERIVALTEEIQYILNPGKKEPVIYIPWGFFLNRWIKSIFKS